MSDLHTGYEPHVEHAFTDQEWQALKREDYKGATAVVLLMLGIFTTGIVLYSIVAFTM